LSLHRAATPALAQEPVARIGFVEAIQQALDANSGLASQQASLDATRENIAKARSKFLPRVELAGGAFFSEITTTGPDSILSQSDPTVPYVAAILSQTLFDYGKFRGVKIQESLAQSAEEGFRGAREQLILQMGQTYMGALLATEILRVQEANRELTGQNLALAREREARGISSRQEVLRWETQEYSDQSSVVSSRAQVVAGRVEFNQLRDRPSEEEFVLEDLPLERLGFFLADPLIADSAGSERVGRLIRDYMVQIGFTRSPELASLGAEIEAQQREVEVAKLGWLPTASLFGGRDQLTLSSSGVRTKTGIWFVGVGVSWPIFQGGAVRAGARQEEATLRELELQRAESTSSLDRQIRAAASQALASFEAWVLAGRQAEVAAENYRLVSDAYRAGQSSTLDLLDAQSTRLDADLSRTVAYYQFLADLLTLEADASYFHFLEPADEVAQRTRDLRQRIASGT
jgi:outer membrane protein TolC